VDLASGQNLTEFPTGQDIYEVVPDDEVFRVSLRQADALRFSGSCYLEILRDLDRNLFHIALRTKDEPSRLIVQWQIDHIRQYGSNSSAFKFQSGGKSTTGVGWFIVETESGAALRIHKAVDYWAKYIVDQIKSMGQRERTRAPPAPGSRTTHPNPHLASSIDSRPGKGAYAPLTVTTMDQPPVYQSVSATASGGRRAHRQNSPGAGSGTYQSLGVKDDPSTYEAVNPYQGQEGEPGARGSSTPPSGDGLYMGLTLDTRQPDQGGTYAVPERK
jgi:hypothetical protein